MSRLVTGGALGWLCVACVLGAAAACSDSEEPSGGGAESGAAGESTNGGNGGNGGTAGNGGNAGNGGSNAQAGSSFGGEGGSEPVAEGGAGGADGVAGEPSIGGGGAGGEAPCAPAPPTLPENVPALIAAPEGTTLVRHLHAVGTQNYRCTQNPGEPATFTWNLVTPIADLLNSCAVKVGSHAAVPGTVPPVPTWVYEVDGSSVNGVRVDASPVAGAIPELLLEQVAHGGNGVFSNVTFIQRLRTVGGVAPAANTCDAEHVNVDAEVGYTAEYYFYIGGD